MESLSTRCLQALQEKDCETKRRLTLRLRADWEAGLLHLDGDQAPIALPEPGRPDAPRLIAPTQLRQRKLSTPEGRAALIHAIAHIEFNAINLALDAAYRFRGMPPQYYGDWLLVAAEEALHFQLLREHLQGLGHDYGDFDAHNGLWELACRTEGDVLVRMALVPRLMEARGLDVTPGIQAKLRQVGDEAACAILDIIFRDEIGHVAIGNRWYRWCCEQRGVDPLATFRELLPLYHAPVPRPPFHWEARQRAGFSEMERRLIEELVSGHDPR